MGCTFVWRPGDVVDLVVFGLLALCWTFLVLCKPKGAR